MVFNNNNDNGRGTISYILMRRNGFLCLPYVRPFFSIVSKKMKKHIIRTVPKMTNGLNICIKRRADKTNPLEQTGVVYRLDCLNCDASYVGEAKRSSVQRYSERYTASRSSQDP